MKINYQQLSQQLRQNIAPLYWLSGDEPLQCRDGADMIRQAIRAWGAEERLRFDVETNFDWSILRQHLEHRSLFSEKKLLELHFQQAKFDAVGREQLQRYIAKPPTDCVLLITSPKLERQTSRAVWYRAIEQAGVIIQVWPLEGGVFRSWVQQQIRQYKLHFKPDATQQLIEATEGNLLACEQVLRQLALSTANQTVTTTILATILDDHARFTIFHYSAASICGEKKRCMRILHSLKQGGTEPILLLWALSKDLRLLARLSYENDAKILQKEVPVPQHRRCLQQALERRDRHHWQECILSAAIMDQAIKGALHGDIWLGLETLTQQVAS